jgi:hypothetical protein
MSGSWLQVGEHGTIAIRPHSCEESKNRENHNKVARKWQAKTKIEGL